MLSQTPNPIEDLLAGIATAIDIPDHLYENATLCYQDVGEWLSADDSPLAQHSPEIYAQGSFSYGTVVAPLNRDGEYDIDLVCHLQIKKENTTQRDLKTMVGNRLRNRADLAKILGASRRCWTLDYPRQFHMDVLPAIPNNEAPPTGILLTDRDLRLWQESNPKAYADWFRSRMKIELTERRASLAKAAKADVEAVPEWQVKTPLQQAIQLLKRHRDTYFQNLPEACPASIIITTLSALAYRNQPSIYEALLGIVGAIRAPGFIERRAGVWWIPNPVHPEENFADKWNEDPERPKHFFAWVDRVRMDFESARALGTIAQTASRLAPTMGNAAVSRAARKLGIDVPGLPAAINPLVPQFPSLGDTTHTQPVPWPMLAQYQVRVTGSVHKKQNSVTKLWSLTDRPVPRNVWLRFRATTNAPPPYEVKWQVVNTGPYAVQQRSLRGDFYESNGNGPDIRWERTEYLGTHWVEAFVVRGGVVVARSGRTMVKIRD